MSEISSPEWGGPRPDLRASRRWRPWRGCSSSEPVQAQLGVLAAARAAGLSIVTAGDPSAPGFRYADRRAIVSIEDEQWRPRARSTAWSRPAPTTRSRSPRGSPRLSSRIRHRGDRAGRSQPYEAARAQGSRSRARASAQCVRRGRRGRRRARLPGRRRGAGEAAGERGIRLARATARSRTKATADALADSRGEYCLVEELISRASVTVNAFSVDGRFVPLTVTDREQAPPPRPSASRSPTSGRLRSEPGETGEAIETAAAAARLSASSPGRTTQVLLTDDGPLREALCSHRRRPRRRALPRGASGSTSTRSRSRLRLVVVERETARSRCRRRVRQVPRGAARAARRARAPARGGVRRRHSRPRDPHLPGSRARVPRAAPSLRPGGRDPRDGRDAEGRGRERRAGGAPGKAIRFVTERVRGRRVKHILTLAVTGLSAAGTNLGRPATCSATRASAGGCCRSAVVGRLRLADGVALAAAAGHSAACREYFVGVALARCCRPRSAATPRASTTARRHELGGAARDGAARTRARRRRDPRARGGRFGARRRALRRRRLPLGRVAAFVVGAIAVCIVLLDATVARCCSERGPVRRLRVERPRRSIFLSLHWFRADALLAAMFALTLVAGMRVLAIWAAGSPSASISRRAPLWSHGAAALRCDVRAVHRERAGGAHPLRLSLGGLHVDANRAFSRPASSLSSSRSRSRLRSCCARASVDGERGFCRRRHVQRAAVARASARERARRHETVVVDHESADGTVEP